MGLTAQQFGVAFDVSAQSLSLLIDREIQMRTLLRISPTTIFMWYDFIRQCEMAGMQWRRSGDHI
jgi:hypothetical protein